MALAHNFSIVILLSLFIAIAESSQFHSKPNILFILADDLGWGNVGYHNNNGEVHTPNIEYLVKHGLELNRHYAHYSCSPTRSSIQSGRLPVHVHLANNEYWNNIETGVPPNMTCIAERLKHDANYNTYFVGKWDAGATVIEQTPFGRGYDQTFGYLNHMNDYWNDVTQTCGDQHITDLWHTNKPAYGKNNTGAYEEQMFSDKMYEFMDDAAAKKEEPFFIFYASHIAHSPLEIPEQYLHEWDNDESLCQKYSYNGRTHTPLYPGFNTSSDNWFCRSIYQSMVHYLDIIIGNITAKLHANGEWNNTLIIFSADNGGEEHLEETAANNYPLRGKKWLPFEGGIRVNAFVSGGFLPNDRRNKVENGMMHVCDWYHTLCYLAGLDPTDTRAEKAYLPPIDGLNMWPLISGQNTSSPRMEIAVDEHTLIDGKYKFINGTKLGYASWTGDIYPNATSNGSLAAATLDCMMGCLFDVVTDATEHNNIIEENMSIAKQMNAKLNQLKKSYYSNNETGISYCPKNTSLSCQCWAAFNMYDGYWGPCQYLPYSNININ